MRKRGRKSEKSKIPTSRHASVVEAREGISKRSAVAMRGRKTTVIIGVRLKKPRSHLPDWNCLITDNLWYAAAALMNLVWQTCCSLYHAQTDVSTKICPPLLTTESIRTKIIEQYYRVIQKQWE